MQLSRELITLQATPKDKAQAIENICELFVASGKTTEAYATGMLARESQENTYLGKGIAIPHGTPETRQYIKETAIAVLQVPEGVVWGEDGELAYLLVGIAADGDQHLQILRRLTRLLNDDETLQSLFHTQDASVIAAALSEKTATAEEASNTADANSDNGFAFSKTVTVPNPLGMHARPATRLRKLVKSFDSDVIIQTSEGKQANANKMFEVLGLGLVKNAQITILSDSERAVTQVTEAIEKGLGDELNVAPDTTKEDKATSLWQPKGEIKTFQGVGASDGLVIGKIRRYGQQHFDIPKTSADALTEAAALDNAIQISARAIHALIDEEGENHPDDNKTAIFEAHLTLLNDSDTINDSVTKIMQGDNAAKAYKAVTDVRIAELSAVADDNIAARAADIRDVRNRVMNVLLGIKEEKLQYDEPVIICAEDLTPSDTAKLRPNHVLGFITALGGPTSHSAIIARGMGLPAVVAAGEAVRDIPDDTMIIMDGVAGRVYVNPNPSQLASAKKAQDTARAELEMALKGRLETGQTADGHRIEIAANINRADAAEDAIDAGAEGVGLMRTEFLYLERTSIPTEAEQEAEYRAMATAMGDKPLIIRTLDIGGDKEVSYLGLRHEDNAFLGIRGIRLCFERENLFLPQLRAICRVAKDHKNIRVMFPMISQLSDWRRAKAMLDNVREAVGASPFPVGIMIEVPAAAILAPHFAKEVDFFSIGTNDLTQYTLAMDRMHPLLANQADALDPAVLSLIAKTVKAAEDNGKWVGVCGGAAGELTAAKVLVGLGVRELSVSPPQIASIKQMLRAHSLLDLQQLANEALIQESAVKVRQVVKSFSTKD